jgi:Large ribosomal RNA subunit accumulation protein YceD
MTQNSAKTGELTWKHAAHDIPASGMTRSRSADAEELAGVARALGLLACASLQAEYTVIPSGGERYHVFGTVRAQVTQACVVTLEPIASAIEERFDVTFWPAEDMPAPMNGVLSLDEEPDPEPILEGQIAVGRLVFECLATAIEPFPRKPDAALEQTSTAPGAAGGGNPASPFAVLAKIRTMG